MPSELIRVELNSQLRCTDTSEYVLGQPDFLQKVQWSQKYSYATNRALSNCE